MDRPVENGIRLWHLMVGAFLLLSILVAVFLSRLPGINLQVAEGLSPLADAFVPVSVLVSAWAFIALYKSIKLQRQQLLMQAEELKLQRLELEKTTAELRGQREQLEAQNLTLRTQSFEDKFFRLLTLLGDIVRDLKAHQDINRPKAGRESFKVWCDQLLMFWREEMEKRNSNQEEFRGSDRQVIERAYRRLVGLQLDREGDCGHYFRTMYSILRFVKSSDVANQQFYADIAKALLSKHELRLLFYNCLTSMEYQELKPLVEEYSLFERLDQSELFNPGHRTLYEEAAYGRSYVGRVRSEVL